MEKVARKIIGWVRENPVEFWILAAILIIGAFCRLYKIDQYMTFLGDEGRDAIIVRRIFTELHPPLIGPGTSVGNMYLGPLYYYMMAAPLLIAGFSPVGPAVMVAVLGVTTIAFVWWVGRTWFDRTAGLVAAGIYAISPVVIYYSRSSWNPNIMPFFALLSVYSIWKVWAEKRFGWLIVLGASFAFVLQSHYLGILLAPTLFIFWFLTYRQLIRKRVVKPFIKKSGVGFTIFLVLMSPLLIFDLRHNWMNSKAIYTFFTNSQGTVSLTPLIIVRQISKLLVQINLDLLGGRSQLMAVLLSVMFVVGLFLLLLNIFKKSRNNLSKINPAYYILISWIGFAIVGLSMFRQAIYDHYIGFIFVVPFLIFGAIVSFLFRKGKIPGILGGFFVILVIALNLYQNPFRFAPNRQLMRSEDVARKILAEDSGRPFNLAVIAQTNYEDGYGYFLELWGAKTLHADVWDSTTIADQLFVVCEMEEEKCDPTHSPKAEVANFGWSKIDASWQVDGVTIYKLVHSR